MKLSVVTSRPQHVLGIHFFNPVPVLSLVELVPSLTTSEETTERARAFVHDGLGKHAIDCQDRAGFVVNALLIPFILSAIRMMESGFATAEDIDQGFVRGAAHPQGPLCRPDRTRHHQGRRRVALRGVQGAPLRPAAAAGPDGRRRPARAQDRTRLLHLHLTRPCGPRGQDPAPSARRAG